MDDSERDDVRKAFDDGVNMTPKELEEFLDSDASKEVGQKSSQGAESVGHEMGRHIVEIKRTKKADLSDDDYAHMKKVNGYIARHLKQGGPKDDAEHSKWRYSLMNWGHDPLK